MTEEGELKKRIKFKVDEENAPEEGYWVVDITNEVIDEAKKEFPEHETEGFDELLYLLEDKNEWFKKYFGGE